MNIFDTLKNLQKLTEVKQAVDELLQELRALDTSIGGLHKRLNELQKAVKAIAGGGE